MYENFVWNGGIKEFGNGWLDYDLSLCVLWYLW